MAKGTNLAVVDLKKGIVDVVNASNMPISVVSLVLQSLLAEVKASEELVLEQERQSYANEQMLNAERLKVNQNKDGGNE